MSQLNELTPPSQLLIRNAKWFTQGHWLIVNPTDNQIFSQLPCEKVSAFYQFYDQYLTAPNDMSCQFGSVLDGPSKYDGVVIYMPKSKQHLRMLLQNVQNFIHPECPIMLVGENKGGIKSANKLLIDVADNVYKIDSAKHCTLLSGRCKVSVKMFDIEDWKTKIDVQIGQEHLSIITLPGVFSSEGLDSATKLLLETIPVFSKQKWLDFACGCGVIGCFLAKRNNQVTLSDVNALALTAANMTAKENDLDVKVIPSNGLEQVSEKYHGIITNPPFHTGIKTDYSVTEAFIQQVPKFMLKKAQVFIVANSFLKYFPLIDKSFNTAKTLVKNAKFAVYMGSNE